MAAAVAPVAEGGLGESAERGHAHDGEQEEAGGRESKASGVMMTAAMARAAAAVDTMNCFMESDYAGRRRGQKTDLWHLWHLLHRVFQNEREKASGLKNRV